MSPEIVLQGNEIIEPFADSTLTIQSNSINTSLALKTNPLPLSHPIQCTQAPRLGGRHRLRAARRFARVLLIQHRRLIHRLTYFQT